MNEFSNKAVPVFFLRSLKVIIVFLLVVTLYHAYTNLGDVVLYNQSKTPFYQSCSLFLVLLIALFYTRSNKSINRAKKIIIREGFFNPSKDDEFYMPYNYIYIGVDLDTGIICVASFYKMKEKYGDIFYFESSTVESFIKTTGSENKLTINLKNKKNPFIKVNSLTKERTEILFRKLEQTSSMRHLFNIKKREALYGKNYEEVKSKGILIENDY